MKIAASNLENLGFIQDENFPTIFALKMSCLDFLLDDGILKVGQDLSGLSQQIYFEIHSPEGLQGFLKSVNFIEEDVLNLMDHAES